MTVADHEVRADAEHDDVGGVAAQRPEPPRRRARGGRHAEPARAWWTGAGTVARVASVARPAADAVARRSRRTRLAAIAGGVVGGALMVNWVLLVVLGSSGATPETPPTVQMPLPTAGANGVVTTDPGAEQQPAPGGRTASERTVGTTAQVVESSVAPTTTDVVAVVVPGAAVERAPHPVPPPNERAQQGRGNGNGSGG